MHKYLNPYSLNLLRIYGVKWSIHYVTILLKIIIIQICFQYLTSFIIIFTSSHNYITISFFSPTHLLEKAKLDNYFENTLSKFPPYLFLSQCPLKYFH